MLARLPLRLVIAGGGTGGHVLPAVAVLNELRARDIPLDALWIGSHDGIERAAAANESVPFAAIPTGKFRRYADIRSAKDALKVPLGVMRASKLLGQFKPDVVLSTGGFVSVPTVFASRGRYPVLTHEQTTILGMATKINMRSATVLALSFESTLNMVGNRHLETIITGNPIRAALFDGDARCGRDRYGYDDRLPVLFVTGGARGASPINQRIKAILGGLLAFSQVIHQTGPAAANNDFAELSAYRETLPEDLKRRYVVTEYIGSEIADIYAMSDLVLCRAGAGTISEISALGKAAIMIPLPLSGGGEQVVNARFLAGKDAGVMIPQDQADSERLLGEIRRLLTDDDERKRMSEAAAALGQRDAGSRLTDVLLRLAHRN